MKAFGNGTVEQCLHNLICIQQGEVPFLRLCGIDPAVIDKPAGEAAVDLIACVQEMIEDYEPRAQFDECDIETLLSKSADYGATVRASQVTEEEES